MGRPRVGVIPTPTLWWFANVSRIFRSLIPLQAIINYGKIFGGIDNAVDADNAVELDNSPTRQLSSPPRPADGVELLSVLDVL